MKKIKDIYNSLDTIPVCDRQTDILPQHIRAMHTRRAVMKTQTPNFCQWLRFVWLMMIYKSELLTIDCSIILSTMLSCRPDETVKTVVRLTGPVGLRMRAIAICHDYSSVAASSRCPADTAGYWPSPHHGMTVGKTSPPPHLILPSPPTYFSRAPPSLAIYTDGVTCFLRCSAIPLRQQAFSNRFSV